MGYLDDTAERIILLAKSSIVTSVGNIPDGEANDLYISERYPYFTIDTGPMRFADRDSNSNKRTHVFLLKLHVAKEWGDLDAARARRARDWIVGVLDYFMERPQLRRKLSESGGVKDSSLTALDADGATITSHTRPTAIPHGEGSEIVVTFTIETPCTIWL